MINSKRLIEFTRKWHKMAAMKRPRILFPGSDANQISFIANKGHFVVHTTDGSQFTIPLEYLSTSVFKELLRISEEEFGLPTDGPITLPCDSAFLEYVMSLLKRCIPEDLKKLCLLTWKHIITQRRLHLLCHKAINKHFFVATEEIMVH
ncbi:hypothetical protein Patl1_35772 [Pistacia atlantica]|nr:hypothetical protein Patl1_35772 [Pistacia atlantica]